jgi:hypothetical protein
MFRCLNYLRLELRPAGALSPAERSELRELDLEDEAIGNRLAAWDVFMPIALYLFLVLAVGFAFMLR